MVENSNLPVHIGFIMDGNRRWAKEHGVSVSLGHKAGADSLEETVRNCFNLGIRYCTFYAFSTENWNRSKTEVSALMKLFSHYLDHLLNRWEHSDDPVYHQTRVRFIGDLSVFDDGFRSRVHRIESLSDGIEPRMQFNIAMNYGGRDDILHAFRVCRADGITNPTEEDISKRLYTAGIPDPDLIVRTGGELRLSNFLIWQASYAEYYSDPCYWPDFDLSHLKNALTEYARRVRRFGGTVEGTV